MNDSIVSAAAEGQEEGGFDNKPGFHYRGDTNVERHLNGPFRFPPRRGNTPGTIGSPRVLSDHVTMSCCRRRRRCRSPVFPFSCSRFLFMAVVGRASAWGAGTVPLKGHSASVGEEATVAYSATVIYPFLLSLPPSA